MLHSGVQISPIFSFTIDLHDLPVVLAAGVVMIAAQIFLSRREKWWPGLLLPAAWLIKTLADILPAAALLIDRGYGWLDCMMDVGFKALAIENIPNLLLLAIYAVCYLLRRRRWKKQLKKTQIDDL